MNDTANREDRNAWLKRRNRGFHVTIRDVDCEDFDVQRFIDDLASMRVTFFSFFVGGYVTTYPTDLKYQRESPYLNGRDLAGEIIEAAHAAGIKTLGMIDLGQIPEQAAVDHPDWCAQDREGRPVERLPGLYAACPMGGYQNDYVREIVAEILDRYDLDCVKFGGGSFGFSRSVCHCPNCRESFLAQTGHELPPKEDWDSPVWRGYIAWRLERARERVHKLGEVVHSIDPHMPFMGNSVCFGDPHWTVGASLDVEYQASVADAVQVEIQTRARYDEATGESSWQYLSWPAETARFMTSVSDKPIWVVTSYFLAWPWRRSAMAPVEQKVYLAQVPANGGDPMVNL
ncbi:MAG: family 10 glycosylhydrolase, partial [Anaerolineae bacterium]